MSVHGPNNVERAVQTDPTLLRYASAITEQKKRWESLAEKFDRFQTLPNNMQQGVQTDATCNIQQCWELLANNVASVCTGLQISFCKNFWKTRGSQTWRRVTEWRGLAFSHKKYLKAQVTSIKKTLFSFKKVKETLLTAVYKFPQLLTPPAQSEPSFTCNQKKYIRI